MHMLWHSWTTEEVGLSSTFRSIKVSGSRYPVLLQIHPASPKMGSRGLLLSVSLLGLISAAISEQTILPPDPEATASCRSPKTSVVNPGPKCDYAMTLPFKLTSESESTLCIWLRSEEKVTVKVTVGYYLEEVTIHTKTNTSQYFECVTFIAPKVEKVETIYITFWAVGEKVDVVDRKPVAIDVARISCLPYKSRPIFNLDDIVQLRFPCYDENLKQVDIHFTKATFLNPNGILISQILNPKREHGVVMVTFTTSPLSMLGHYSVQFEDEKGNIYYASFEVQKSKLPRFNWKVQCPTTVSVLERTVDINGNAEYVYGESVEGSIVGRCCRYKPKYRKIANCFLHEEDICTEFIKELDKNGKVTESVSMDPFKLLFSGFEDYIECEITLKEKGTGVLVPSSCYISITGKPAILQLDYALLGRCYNQIDLQFAATLKDEKDRPLSNKSITVKIDGKVVKYVTTDANGRAECRIDTSSYFNPNLTFAVSYDDEDLCYIPQYYERDHPYVEVTLYRCYSYSGSHIRMIPVLGELLCGQDYQIQVEYLFTEEGVGKGATTTSIKYIFMSRDRIVSYGEVIIDLSEGYRGSKTITFHTNAKFATGAKVLAISLLTKDIISDTITLDIAPCFENKVEIRFTDEIVAPGATVYREITADAGSFCGSRAIDASFKLIRSYDEFNAYNLYSSIHTYLFDYQYGGINYRDPKPPCVDGNTEYFYNGMYLRQFSAYTDRYSKQNFEDLNLLFYSNLLLTSPEVCGMEPEHIYHPIFALKTLEGVDVNRRATSSETFRSDFRQGFGYDTFYISSEGISTIETKIPETITSWICDAFCISDKGIGLTNKPATITTKQVFFTEMSLPEEVIRGEQVITSIVAANYVDKCAQITVEIVVSDNYVVEYLDEKTEQCACSEERVFWAVAITFLKTGTQHITVTAKTTTMSNECGGVSDDVPLYSDTIKLEVFVETEGIEKSASYSYLAIIDDATHEVEIAIGEPENLVQDSFHLTVSVVGEVIALSVLHFDYLLSTPIGCCVQMEAVLLPIIFLKESLASRGELSDERAKQMNAKLLSGFMDLLSCVQPGGGFRLYTNMYEPDPWITLASIRTLHHLSRHLFVDPNLCIQSITYLSRKQNLTTGCLEPEAKPLIYQEDHELNILFNTMAAIALHEIGDEISNAGPLLVGINKCLDNVVFENQNTLTKAYLFKAAVLSGKADKYKKYIDDLVEMGITDGGILFWNNDNKWKIVLHNYFPASDTGDILITSLILAGLAKIPNPDENLINIMASIGKWLTTKMTKTGGFYYPQGTAAAIEALAFFASIIGHRETKAEVSIFQDGNKVFSVTVNEGNRYIVQSMDFHPGFGDYRINSKGTGNIMVQLSASFHTHIDEGGDSAFVLIAQASAPECFGGVAKRINVDISIRYIADRAESGTTIVSVGIISGYILDTDIKSQQDIATFLIIGNKAFIYLDKVTRTETKITLSIYMTNRMSNYQPGKVVAEEIETGETGAAQYHYPC